MDDETNIRQLVAERTTAMRTGDAVTICHQYAPDALVFSLGPPLVQPPDGNRDFDQMQAWFQEKGGTVWSEVRDLCVSVHGDLAFCTSLESMGAPPDSPQPFSLWYRSTLGLRRLDGEWRIVHEHASTPFHMDGSFRAATDLQP
ncbi:MAG: nuclear transport factor 2 family protein [Propionibacteriales bacterium]|nr:nuclear transport factor 2 family protein [Propionibacteriales bacterium]